MARRDRRIHVFREKICFLGVSQQLSSLLVAPVNDKNAVQFQIATRKIKHPGSHSPNYAKFGHFTLRFAKNGY